MPRVPRVDIPGALYHVIDRGNERRNIFRTNHDRRDFLQRLSKLACQGALRLFAYCLLDNHFHLLVESTEKRLGHAMGRLLTGYVVAYNLRHNRIGHLFQGRFRAPLCDSDSYLLELIRYIHLNPVRAGIVDAPEDYRWSTHRAYVGRAHFPGLETEPVLSQFHHDQHQARHLFDEFVNQGIAEGARPDLTGRCREAILGAREQEIELHFGGTILGNRGFAEKTLAKAEHQATLAERYQLRAIGIEQVAETVSQITGIETLRLRRSSRRQAVARARSLLCVLAVDELGLRPVQAARYLRISDGAVSHALRRGRAASPSPMYQQARDSLHSLLRD